MLNIKKNTGRKFVPLAFALLLTTVSASADDTEIYQFVDQPNVLFVLDASGSMSTVDSGQTGRRVERMYDALIDLLDNTSGLDIGIMRYTTRQGGGGQLLHPVADVDTNRDSLKRAAGWIGASGGTPTVAALLEAKRYFAGEQPYRGWLPRGSNQYTSPTTSHCESNHIVLLSDGRPTADAAAETAVKNLPGINGCQPRNNDRGTCGTELTQHMATTNQIPHVAGLNTITTHSIGFNIADDWLKILADTNHGNGIYKDAASSNDLIVAFDEIAELVQLTSTGAAPTISVSAFNESRHSDELYFSLFQPNPKPRWEGNIKKYRLDNNEIVDGNGDALTQDGVIKETSQSLWASQPDGKKVSDGGMAGVQPAARRWYTDYRRLPDADGRTTPTLITTPANTPTDIHRFAFGAADDTELNRLISWARGADSIDRDRDGDVTEANFYVADAIHSTPLLLTYKAEETANLVDEVLFTGNNMGVLHALDPKTGESLWSYTPTELLPNIKKYVDNDSTDHVYGLDGAIVPFTTYKDLTTADFELDKAWLFLTQRRGGNSIFALDVSNALDPADPFKILWKKTGGVDPEFIDLAQTWSTPQIIPIKYGCPGASCGTREVLMFSGGYNPLYDDKSHVYDNTVRPTTGRGNAVYLVDPRTGELLWSVGNGAHHDLDLPIMHSVPATPVPVDTDADGHVNVIYFSDIAGHVWRVDFNQQAGPVEDLAKIDGYDTGGMIASLNEPGQALRFFNRIDVVVNGTTSGTATMNLVMGSGMRSSPLYIEPDRNRIFSIQDSWVSRNPVGDAPNPSTGKLEPEYRYVKNTSGTRSVITPSDLWDHNLNDASRSRKYGYFKTFAAGEKILEPTLTHNSRVFLITYMPPDLTQPNLSCEYRIGESRLYILNLLTGDNMLPEQLGNPYRKIGPGIVPSGSIIDTGGNNQPGYQVGTNNEKVIDLMAPDNPNVFRKFHRTGWVELDD